MEVGDTVVGVYGVVGPMALQLGEVGEGYNLPGARTEDTPSATERVLKAGSRLYRYGRDVVK